MSEFNVDRIRQIIGEINSSLHKLARYSGLDEEEFLANEEKVDSAKYNLIIAIEGAIDICNHIVARAGGRAPHDHADCFGILGELNMISHEFADRLKRRAKFRNLLVHLYWKVDNKKVFQILKEDIQDKKIYKKHGKDNYLFLNLRRSTMSERKRVILLVLIMTAISFIVLGIGIYLLYHAGIRGEQSRLEESAQSQARLIEAIARFDSVYSKDYPEGSEKATLSKIIDAHETYRGLGETGEFTLAQRVGDEIIFLLSHRHFVLEYPKPVPFDSKLAEPMRLALSNQSGTVKGLDYRGEKVLAAYEPVAVLNLGIVAKIDLSEIRAPFVRAGLISVGCAFLAIFLGAILFFRITNPMIRNLAESEEQHRMLVETMRDGLGVLDENGLMTYVNKRICEILGRAQDEVIGHRVSDFLDEANRKIFIEQMSKRKESVQDSYELVFSRKDGSKIPTFISPKPILNPEGRFQGSFAVITEITMLKQTENDLRRLKDELEIKVSERTKELQERVNDLERFREATVDRELRMKELREKVEKLEKKLE